MSVLLQILELIRLVSVEFFQLIEGEVLELLRFRRIVFEGSCVPFGRWQVLEIECLGSDTPLHRSLIQRRGDVLAEQVGHSVHTFAKGRRLIHRHQHSCDRDANLLAGSCGRGPEGE